VNKILLINPRLPSRLVRLNIPVSLLYVGTALAEAGYGAEIIDANNIDEGEFYQRLDDRLGKYNVVGLSVMTAQVPDAVKIAKYIKQNNADIPIIWGGVHPTLYPEQVADSGYASYVVVGEGEELAVKLMGAINKRVIMPRLQINTEPMDINRLAHPRWDLLNEYWDYGLVGMSNRTGVGLPLLTSRGCPHRCSFCIGSVSKVKYRFRDADLVVKDIERIVNFGVDTISFWDEDFFANRKRLVDIMAGVEKKGLNFRWFGTARADYFRDGHIDAGMVRWLQKNGCRHLGIGAESGSQRVLDMIKKDITVEDTLRCAEQLSEAGIGADFSFMIGMPGEEPSDMFDTVKLVSQITKIDGRFRILGPFVYRPYPGSKMYEECRKDGMVEPQSLEEWSDNPYIKDRVSPEDYRYYSWVRYPMDKLARIIFYCWLSGVKLRWSILTKIGRTLGALRCKYRFFGFPVELWLRDLMLKLKLDKRLSIGKFG